MFVRITGTFATGRAVTGVASQASLAEQRTASLILALGAHHPGSRIRNQSPEIFTQQSHETTTTADGRTVRNGFHTWELETKRVEADGSRARAPRLAAGSVLRARATRCTVATVCGSRARGYVSRARATR